MEAWINPTRSCSTWMPIVSKDEPGEPRANGLWLNADGSLYSDTRDAINLQGAQTVAGPIPAGAWTQVALVVDRSSATPSIRIFIKGVEAALRSGGGLRGTPAIKVSSRSQEKRILKVEDTADY